MPGTGIEKNECFIQLGQVAMYKFYRQKIKEFGPGSTYDVPMGVMGGIQKDFNMTWMRELIMGKGLVLKLPFRLGRVLCQKYKLKLKLNKKGEVDTKILPVDWYKSKQKWAEMWPGLTMKELKEIPNKPVVYILNEHSDGYRYRIFWEHRKSYTPNNRAYMFVPSRINHRYLASLIKGPEGAPDCYEVKLARRKKRRKQL